MGNTDDYQSIIDTPDKAHSSLPTSSPKTKELLEDFRNQIIDLHKTGPLGPSVGSLERRRRLSFRLCPHEMVRTDAEEEALVKDLKAAEPQRDTVCTKTRC